ncbi:MAG: hypothetical protein JNM00_15175, partial [Flavobacteriales bacterium]|nr:hypothetical protein [Flavobacteriales bacterium]
SMYSEVARQRVRKGKPADDVLEKIGKTSRETIEKMSDIVWSVKSDNDTMDHMIQRMKSYATILFAPQHADVRFEVASGVEHIKLNMNQRRNVFLIFKEAVYNAAKYADCKLLEVTFTTDKKSLTMIIADNGRGFEFPAPNDLGGNGLENMRTRAMEVGGTLEIESHKLSGTRLTLRMKL